MRQMLLTGGDVSNQPGVLFIGFENRTLKDNRQLRAGAIAVSNILKLLSRKN